MRIKYYILFFFAAIILNTSCDKNLSTGENPYSGGKEALGISFTSRFPDPVTALPGEVVLFHVKGAEKFKSLLKFYVNNAEVKVLSVSDSTIYVELPLAISTGPSKISVDNQFFDGPFLHIEGNLSVDAAFRVRNGFNGAVMRIFENSGAYILAGSFTDYNAEKTDKVFLNSIHAINSDATSNSNMLFGAGANSFGSINDMVRLDNGSFIIAGDFTSFNKRMTNRIAKLNANGQLDTTRIDVVNDTENELNNYDTVSNFNAGIADGTILKLFKTNSNKIVVVGNFKNYVRRDYIYSSRNNYRNVLTPATNVMRLETDGVLDSSFEPSFGVNGYIQTAAQQLDGKLILAGNFTKYNNQVANRIIRLNSDGSIDPNFNVGAGADNAVFSIDYVPSLNKIFVGGSFKKFNNENCDGLVVLNMDGSIDKSFDFQAFSNGIPTYVKYLTAVKKLLVSGTFETYGAVKRNGFLLLNNKGLAEQRFNHLGTFEGQMFDVKETTSGLGYPAIIISGDMSIFNGKKVHNLIKIEVKPD